MWETSEESSLPSGQKMEEFNFSQDFVSIKHRRKDQEARNQTKEKKQTPVKVYSFNVPDNVPQDI